MKNDFWKNINKPIIGLSPMDGVTDEPARQIQSLVAKPDVLFTEFVSAEGFVRNPEAFKNTLVYKENERPIVAQVFGYTPEAISESIKIISEMGFDGIDINMGCPARKILTKGGGAALIGNYKLVDEILTKTLFAIKDSKNNIQLSVKTRIGQKIPITVKWVEFLSNYPLSAIIIHGRLLAQGLSGEVNWNEIKKAAKIAKEKNIVIIGNGGIRSIKEAKEKAKNYSLDGILIGQAALGNPWVFIEEYNPTREEIFEIIKKHADLAESFYGEKGFNRVLKHFSWYPKGFDNCKQLKLKLLKTKNSNEVKEVLSQFSATSN